MRPFCYDAPSAQQKSGHKAAFFAGGRWGIQPKPLKGSPRLSCARTPNGRSHPRTRSASKKRPARGRFLLAEGEGFEPPDRCRSSVFKFYPASVACRLLLLFNSPNCRKISVLTALLSDNPGFLLCFGIVSRSLSLLIFSAILTAFCRGFVDCYAWIKKFICCFILFLFLTNTRHGAKQIFAYQSNQESV